MIRRYDTGMEGCGRCTGVRGGQVEYGTDRCYVRGLGGE